MHCSANTMCVVQQSQNKAKKTRLETHESVSYTVIGWKMLLCGSRAATNQRLGSLLPNQNVKIKISLYCFGANAYPNSWLY